MPTSKLSHESEEPDDAVELYEEDETGTENGNPSGVELTKARQKATAANQRKAAARQAKPSSVNPAWLVPTMLALLIGGLVWIVVFYVTSGHMTLPIPSLGQWNLAVGFGLILAGGILTTRYK
ncbi:Uncharacterised protein family (UPF0233) [Micrococcales bacterium KH10]|nr:Uncharacterised protein family (UPF0233) [Micrococcales bacterium KH10]